jgi:hypothetical protein
MEVSGQLHAPAALLPEKQPPVPNLLEAGSAPEPVWRRENIWPILGLEPRFLASSVAIPKLPRFSVIIMIITVIIMVLGSTQPLTEMSTRNLPGGKGAAGA